MSFSAPSLADPPPLPGRAEYRERQERTRAVLATAELDGILAFGSHAWPWAVRWLADHQSGFAGAAKFADTGFAAFVLPVEGPSILVLDQRVGPDAVCADDARTVESLTAGVAAALRDAGLADARLGLGGEGAMLERHRREIEAELGTAAPDLVPADHLLEPLARIKSPAELDCLRHASLVGCEWMTQMMEAIEPGLTEADLVSRGLPALLDAGGFPADVVIGSGNPCRPQAPRGIPSFNAERPLERGDLIRVDGFGPVRSYDCDLARSACVGGEPTGAQREVLEHAVEFVGTLIAAIRPGVTHKAVHDLGTAWLTDRGYAPHAYFEGFWPTFGHQLGLSHEGPCLAAGETEPIQAGQAIAVEIVLGTEETGGIAHEDCVIVTADGTEPLTDACRKRWE